jgi:general secretion pathway protein D
VSPLRTCVILLVLTAVAATAGPGPEIFEEAQRAERSGETFAAYQLYARAVALEPSNVLFVSRKNALQAWAALAPQVSLDLYSDNAPDRRASDAATRIVLEGLAPSEALVDRESLTPSQLKGTPGKKNFDLRGTTRLIYEQVAASFGIKVQFDSNFTEPPPFAFQVADVDMGDALRILEAVSSTFIVPVNEKLALVYQDTTQRRTDSAPVVTMALPIPERMTLQEAQELITTVQQVVDIRKVGVDAGRRLLVIRDVDSKVREARQLMAQLARSKAQVDVEVEILTVQKNSSLSYGLSLQNMVPIVNFSSFLNNVPTGLAGLANFATFGGGATFLGMGIADATALATLSKTSTQFSNQSQVVVLDGQAATLHVGDSYPIITSGFLGGQTTNPSGFAAAPAVQYKDLGLVLKVTPTVHEGGEVSLDVEAEYDTLSGASNHSIPVVSSRKFTGKTRLRFGEWAVIAGLAVDSSSRSTNGTAGLMRIPLLGHLFHQDVVSHSDSQTLIILKPRLVNIPPFEFASREMWVGTESRPLTVY